MAKMLIEVDPRPGECVFHLGCGTGYYTAILAEIVGADGSVSAVEIDDGLVRRARMALSQRQNVSVVGADGREMPENFYDGIIVSAGLNRPMNGWTAQISSCRERKKLHSRRASSGRQASFIFAAAEIRTQIRISSKHSGRVSDI